MDFPAGKILSQKRKGLREAEKAKEKGGRKGERPQETGKALGESARLRGETRSEKLREQKSQELRPQERKPSEQKTREQKREVIHGRVTNVVPGIIEGWVINSEDPTERLTVICMAGEERVYETLADIFQAELRDYGVRDCYHGFRIAYDPRRYPLNGLKILARTAGGTVETFTLREEAPSAPIPAGGEASLLETSPLSQPIEVFFDVSDLLAYFRDNRFPTGIQRVQMEVICSFFDRKVENLNVSVCAFSPERNFWAEVPFSFFNHICKMCIAASEEKWAQTVESLKDVLQNYPYVKFPKGAYLVNLGTSWWLSEYFIRVRHAKKNFNIKYVPFVHDFIPIMVPEVCVENLRRDFVFWVNGVFEHADLFICNSNYTKTDLYKVANYLERKVEDEPVVVRLDADFRSLTENLPDPKISGKKPDDTKKIEEILDKLGIEKQNYVLFVSTIEPRKNHGLVFSAWLRMAKARGEKNVPQLLCVGKDGWLNESIYAQVMVSDILKKKVTFLSNLSDIELSYLYSNCLCTVYPSSYEGWGLPVTESLCYGKVPVVANRTSLPEAGGEFAEYFDPDDLKDLTARLEKVIYDPVYRAQRENHIRTHFRPRSWQEIGDEIISALRRHEARAPAKEATPWSLVKEAVGGQYYFLGSIDVVRPLKGLITGELFRQGEGWWWPERWGCWTKQTPARLEFTYRAKGERVRLYVGIKGVPGKETVAALHVDGAYRRTIPLAPDQVKWVVFYLDPDMLANMPQHEGKTLIGMTVTSSQYADFREYTNGMDYRISGIGVIGFMICDESDMQGRLSLFEKIALNDETADLQYAEFRSPLLV
jgi:glycosyltransferase involved in cell wall biosynthesis